MRIRIKQLPTDTQIEGFDLRPFEPGHVYDVSARLGAFLVVSDYAEPEMRRTERATTAERPRRFRNTNNIYR